jgi:hypothetical protein
MGLTIADDLVARLAFDVAGVTVKQGTSQTTIEDSRSKAYTTGIFL